jgi:signal transduction histidine kinase
LGVDLLFFSPSHTHEGRAMNVTTCEGKRNAIRAKSIVAQPPVARSLRELDRDRQWIARELHDDVCQRLTLLALRIGQVRGNTGGPAADRDARLLEIQQYCAKLACDVQALSQGLHSSTLEYLGIEAGLESLCRDFAAHHHVRVCFYPENIPAAVHKDLELGLYRVAQEALQNAGKHSRSGDFSVTLRGTGDELNLEIRDRGVGFSPKDATGDGLGLISMKKRVQLMSGSFSIESKAN